MGALADVWFKSGETAGSLWVASFKGNGQINRPQLTTLCTPLTSECATDPHPPPSHKNTSSLLLEALLLPCVYSFVAIIVSPASTDIAGCVHPHPDSWTDHASRLPNTGKPFSMHSMLMPSLFVCSFHCFTVPAKSA